MDRAQAKALLPIIQAFAEGRIIESQAFQGGEWEARNSFAFDGTPTLYRIARRTIWAVTPVGEIKLHLSRVYQFDQEQEARNTCRALNSDKGLKQFEVIKLTEELGE